MFSKITKGKVIAGFISLAITGFFWNLFFPPGGSGANVLLGLFVAIFFCYYFSLYVGSYLDQELFPGGSKSRARLYRALESYINESTTHISAIKKSKKKRLKLGQNNLDNFEHAIIQAVLVLNTVRDAWSNTASCAEHERMLKESNDRLEQASKSVFSLDKNWRFLYGMPSLILALLCALALREFVIEPYQIPSGSMIPSLLVGDHLFVSKFHYGLSKPFSSDPDFIIQWQSPKPGDVVVFKSPDYVGRHAGQPWIKRVIATAGQTVRMLNNVLYVDDKPYEHIGPDEQVSYPDYDYFGFGGAEGGMWKEQKAIRTIEKIGSIEHQIHMPLYAGSQRLGAYWPVNLEDDMPGLSCTQASCRVKEGHIFVMGDNRGNSADSRIWGALPVARVKGKAMFIWMSVDGSAQSISFGPFNLPRFRFSRWFSGIT